MAGQEERDVREQQARKHPESALAGSERESSELEQRGMDLLGNSSVRGGAIDGVSDPSARHDQQMRDPSEAAPRPRARRDPGEAEAAGTGDGGLSASGGAAGGARGHGGRSDAMESLDSGDRPAEHKGTSRMDLDHTGTEAAGGQGSGAPESGPA